MSRWNSAGARRPDQLLLTRSGRHAVWRRRLMAATAVGVVSSTAGTALADSASVWISGVSAPPIVVESNGSTYSGVSSPAIPIEGNLRVMIDAQISGKVKSYRSWPRLVLEDGGTNGFLARGESINYSRPRPKSVDRTKRFAITKSDYEEAMVRACVERADVLRSQGLSNTQIFGQDRQVPVIVEGRLVYDISGIAGQPVPPEVPPGPLPSVTVNCQGHEPVVSSDLEIVEQSSVGGACRLRFDGRIVTTRPNEDVSFRYADEAGNQSGVITVRTNGGKVATFSNTDKLPSGSNRGRIRIVGVSSTFNTAWQEYDLDCNQPTGITMGTPQAAPEPPSASVAGLVVTERIFQGFICPDRISINGTITGRGLASSGVGTIFLENQYKLRQDFDISGDGTDTVVYRQNLTWGNPGGGLTLGSSGNTEPPAKTFAMQFKLADDQGHIIDTTFRRHTFACRPSTQSGQSAQVSGSHLATQQAEVNSTIEQKPAGVNVQMARPAAVPAFAIQSPQGRVRKGEIRLSGGKANSKYLLRFYRKTSGSYQHVRKAQLPKRMTGKRANFDLSALDGGRAWRLQVCPVGTTGISSTQNCKTSDFRLPRIGVKKPAGEAPVKGGKFKPLAPKKVK